jgi:hypothetical protein
VEKREHLSKIRILAFSWSNPILVESYLNLVGFLKSRFNTEFYFITNNSSGKLMFLEKGINAFTVSELCSYIPPDYDAGISRDDRDSLSEFDRKISDIKGPKQIVTAYSLLFDTIEPNIVLTWNGVCLLQKTLSFLAERKGVPIFFLERGLLPGTLVIDPKGVNYGSHIAGSGWDSENVPVPGHEKTEALRQYCKRLQKEGQTIVEHGRELSASEMRQQLDISRNDRVVLLPLQIEYDSNIVYYSPYYKKMMDIIKDMEEAIKGINNVIMIVKPHPEDRDRLSELESICSSRTRISMDISLGSMLRIADVVVAVNSTVGLEALTQYKPVVVLGRAIYGEKGFTFDLDEKGNLRERLKQALDAAEKGLFNEDLFLNFLSFLLEQCLFSLDADDKWGSRENIAKKIISAGTEISKRPLNITSVIKKLFDNNLELMKIFGPSDTIRRGESVSVILPSHNEFIINSLRKKRDNVRIEMLTKANALQVLFKKYDYAIFVGVSDIKMKIFWPFVRAEHKVSLI